MKPPRMKKADVKKAIEAGTVLACSSQGPYGGNPLPGDCAKVIAVAVDRPRRVYTGARADWGGHVVRDGFRVRVVAPAPSWGVSPGPLGTVGEEVDVAPKNLLAPWETYAALRDQTQEAQDQRRRALTEKRTLAEAAAEALGGSVRPMTSGGEAYGYLVSLSLQRATEIAEELEMLRQTVEASG